jgi:hypothetical protein
MFFWQTIGGSQFPNKAGAVRVLQIITFALAQGVVVFGVVVLFLNGAAVNGQPEILTWTALGMAGLMIVMHFVIPPVFSRAALSGLKAADLKDKSEDGIFELIGPAFQTQHIVACALLEAAAFFNLIAYMIEKSLYPLVAAGVLIALILIRMPTTTRIEFWVSDRAREIELR